ncbi:MAG: D-xylose transport system substrate-binding protein [Gaiellales bacterium]|jgi:D-xylose transport system substrate-binding protein|nr:D-xylose transport system substrate-binding protein [Gaiellales bacterium]
MCASRRSEVHILTKGTGVKKLIPVIGLALAAIAGTATTVAQGKVSSSKAGAEVCTLLPDPKSSVRWETQDRPAFVAAFKKAGVTYVINNANGDAQRQKTQADQCIGNGAKVVILVSLDAGSSLAIESAAKAGGAKVIEYDRQVTGGKPEIYISFDGKSVGVLQGKGVVAALKANGMYSKKPVVAELNGGQEDNNSTLFKSGYDSVLKPLYANGTFKKGPDQFVPAWNNQTAGTIFEQMLVKTSNKIDGVAAANDGLANAVVVALKAHKLKPIPLSGQDATVQGVQNIISGWQTLSVFKDTRLSATNTAQAAVALLKGQKPKTTGKSVGVPAYIYKPVSITKANYTSLFASGYLKKKDVCVGAYAKFCK